MKDAQAWAGIADDALVAVLTALGDPNLDNLVLFAGVDPAVIRHTIDTVQAVESGAPVQLNPFTRVKFGLLYNACRCKFGLDLVDVTSKAPATPQAAAAQAGAAATALTLAPGSSGQAAPQNPMHTIRLSSVLDQASDAEVQKLTSMEVADKRQRFASILGGEPLEHQEFSDSQLSAMVRTVEAGNPPFADFAIFRRNGVRAERQMKFKTHVRDVDGGWKIVEVPGPASYEDWEASWEIFRSVCIAGEIATLASLDIYLAKFKERVREYPKAWHLAATADLICRSEEWVLGKRRLERAQAASPNLSLINPSMP